MSNAKRRPEPEHIPNIPNDPARETDQKEKPVIAEDRLGGYRTAVTDLNAFREKASALRAIEQDVLGQIAKLESDREALLDLATETDIDNGVDVGELNMISGKLEIARRKLSDLSARAQQAESESKGVLARVAGQLMVPVEIVLRMES